MSAILSWSLWGQTPIFPPGLAAPLLRIAQNGVTGMLGSSCFEWSDGAARFGPAAAEKLRAYLYYVAAKEVGEVESAAS